MQDNQTRLTPSAAKAVLRRQLRGVLDAARVGTPLTDDAIHLTRTTLKRARTSLRLLRDAVGTTVYARENAALRDAARLLARIRDAKASIDALDRLLAREKEAAGRGALEKLRPRLLRMRAGASRELRAGDAIQKCVQAVEACMSRLDRQRLRGDTTRLLSCGLERIYRRGRKSLAAVAADDSDENLHELRKQAKLFGQALKMFGGGDNTIQARQRRLAKSVAGRLGDDHDLFLLHAQISGLPIAQRSSYASMLERIAQRRAQLQSKALKQARRMYGAKAKTFIDDVAVAR